MNVKLFRRHFGIHSLIKEVEIDLDFKKIVKKPKDPNDDFIINEKTLLEHLPIYQTTTATKKLMLFILPLSLSLNGTIHLSHFNTY